MSRHLFVLTLALTLAACDDSHELDAGAGVYGAPCSSSMPCPGSLGCVETPQFPGGYCTATCTTDCAGEADCVDTTTPPLCLARCETAADCREGYQCWRGNCGPMCSSDTDCGAGGACRDDGFCAGAMCTTTADCGPGQACRGGQCVESLGDGGVGGLPHGSPCTEDAECEGGWCLPPELGGVCSLSCTQATDCFVFEVEAGCSAPPLDRDGDGVPEIAPQICVLSPPGSLGTAQLCTEDIGCLARLCQEGQCTEVCDDDSDCVPGQMCTNLARAGVPGATYMGCGYGPVGSGGVLSVELDTVDLQTGRGTTLSVATPPDAVSLTLEAEDLDRGLPLELSFVSVIDPDGTLLFDVNEIAMLNDQPIRWLPADTTESITMLVPNTTPDRVEFVPGLHTFTVSPIPRFMGDTASTRLRIVARVKRAPGGVLNAGRLDLNVHIVPGISGLSAASAPTNSRMQGGLGRMRAILSTVGITIGTIRYVDVNQPALTVIDTTDGPDSELSTLFRTSGTTLGGDALDVFIVRSISAGGGGFRALGIAGGIPGPANLHGSRHSGVVSSWAGLGTGSTGDRVLGQILAHEIGHYLGLFHVTEQARPCGPGEIPGTDDCAPFGATDPIADTTRGDTTNLMHWSIVGSGSNTALTNGQGFVLRAAALVRP